MLLSAVSVLVVSQSSSEIPEELTNNPVVLKCCVIILAYVSVNIVKYFLLDLCLLISARLTTIGFSLD